MTTATDLRKLIERERIVRFWGGDYRITPRFVEEPLGDGGQLIWLEPMDTRPNYYVLRVDSSWDLDDFSDHLESVYEAIENEYGPDDFDEDDDGGERGWPRLSTGSGVSWGDYDLKGEDV